MNRFEDLVASRVANPRNIHIFHNNVLFPIATTLGGADWQEVEFSRRVKLCDGITRGINFSAVKWSGEDDVDETNPRERFSYEITSYFGQPFNADWNKHMVKLLLGESDSQVSKNADAEGVNAGYVATSESDDQDEEASDEVAVGFITYEHIFIINVVTHGVSKGRKEYNLHILDEDEDVVNTVIGYDENATFDLARLDRSGKRMPDGPITEQLASEFIAAEQRLTELTNWDLKEVLDLLKRYRVMY